MPLFSADEDYDVAEYYREQDAQRPWYYGMRRRGYIRPGMSGYRPITIIVSAIMAMAGALDLVSAALFPNENSGPAVAIGLFLILWAIIFPIYSIRKDDQVKAEVAYRKQQRMAEEGPVEQGLGGFHTRAPHDDVSDDNVWIPGQTHDPVGSKEGPRPVEDVEMSKEEPEEIIDAEERI